MLIATVVTGAGQHHEFMRNQLSRTFGLTDPSHEKTFANSGSSPGHWQPLTEVPRQNRAEDIVCAAFGRFSSQPVGKTPQTEACRRLEALKGKRPFEIPLVLAFDHICLTATPS